jgi:hypothetical protein
MPYLKFNVEVNTWLTREPDETDQWDNGSSDGQVTVTECRLATFDTYNALPVSFSVKRGDIVWLVWAQYSTGDSFGSYGGQYELCGAFASEADAGKEAARLTSVTDYSVPWNGYFESLDFIKVEPFEVQA